MKKSLVGAVAVLGMSVGMAWAGHFTDLLPPASTAGCVPVSNGYDYQCSSDNGSTGINTTGLITASSGTFSSGLTLGIRTLAQINALTPVTTGQMMFCSNCTSTPVCVSSSAFAHSFVALSSGVALGFQACN